MRITQFMASFMFICTLLIASGSVSANASEDQKTTLYDRLGGVYAIASVVDVFIDRLLINATLNSNPTIDEARDQVPAPGLKYQVTAFVIQAAGGPDAYFGRSMPESHAHLNITERQWQAMVAELEGVLYSFNVPDPERNELIELIGTVKDQIVSQP